MRPARTLAIKGQLSVRAYRGLERSVALPRAMEFRGISTGWRFSIAGA